IFASRRRDAIFARDWSSDVCSSDLAIAHARRFGRIVSRDLHGVAVDRCERVAARTGLRAAKLESVRMRAAVRDEPAVHVLEIDDDRIADTSRTHGCGTRWRNRFTVDHVPSRAREPITDLLLVRRMNVPAIAEIDRDREARVAIVLDGKALRFAQARPPALDRFGRRLAEVRELDDEERC